MAGSVIEISSIDQFRDILKKEKYVVIDFYATWCGPCNAIAPKFVDLAKQETRVAFLKVNVDNNDLSSLPMEYGVGGIPAFYFIKDGAKVDSVVGANLVEINSKLKALTAQ